MLNAKSILLVEDDNIDAMTVQRSLRDLGSKVSLVRSTNGEEALKYLQDSINEKPCIILLDLNMPKMNGIEFLRVMKTDEKLKHIPVIVFTASKEEYDVIKSFELSVAGYIIKSFDYQQFLESMRMLHTYWNLCLLPQNI
ncbi:MAG: response regulator [Sedimentisphaerales bacterium]|nr:response regulator [Sedimentisphaerales bacterium]